MHNKKSDSSDEEGIAFKRWVAGLAAITVAVSVGLVTADVRLGKQRQKVLRTDANWQRAASKAMAEAPFWKSEDEIEDEVLNRPDKGSDQHG